MRFNVFDEKSIADNGRFSHIAWYGGLQLLPQHFQAWDDRLDAIFYRNLYSANPHAWGIDSFEIDSQALSAGKIRILSAAGCFPDGLIFNWNSKSDGLIEADIDVDTDLIRYALTVPKYDFSEGATKLSRFRQIVGDPLRDRENIEEMAAITRWRPNLYLAPWQPTNSRYSQIPLVEVRRAAVGYQATDYYPPATSLLQDSSCARDVGDLTRLLRNKASQLNAPSALSALEAECNCGVQRIQTSLVAGLPKLEAQLSNAAHPYEIFLSLSNIAGLVSTLADKLPDKFPHYEHEDPRSGIDNLIIYIRKIVDGIDLRRRLWTEIPFILSGRDWRLQIDLQTDYNDLLIQVVFESAVSDLDVNFWLNHTLICFDEEIERNRGARVRGLPRKLVNPLPGEGLEATSTKRYLRVNIATAPTEKKTVLFIAGPESNLNLPLQSVSILELVN
jgi:type VI secretion system protein ImpJ